MKFAELVESTLTGEKVYPLTYLPIEDKYGRIEAIAEHCLVEEKNFTSVNIIFKEIATVCGLVADYYDVEDLMLDVDTYNTIMKCGFYKNIVQDNEDIIAFFNLLEASLEEKLKKMNSFEAKIASFLDDVSKKIPDQDGMTKMFESIPKMINKIKPDRLEMIKSAFGQKKE